jgi:hypothetical protein
MLAPVAMKAQLSVIVATIRTGRRWNARRGLRGCFVVGAAGN